MRGAQPATSAGARLFAGIPIPAFLTIPQRAVKKSILNLLFKLAARCTSECPLFLREDLASVRVNVLANSSTLLWNSFAGTF
jgi:hypothetical protein